MNAVIAALSLLLVPTSERTVIFWGFLLFIAYLIISSYVLMWLRKQNLSQESIGVQVLARINRQLGKPETIFSAFFLWGAVRQYSLNSNEFNVLLWFWIVFMVLNVPAIASAIASIFVQVPTENTQNNIGKIFGVQLKNRFQPFGPR